MSLLGGLGGLGGGFGAATVSIGADLTQLRKDLATAKGEVAKGTSTMSQGAAKSRTAWNIASAAAIIGIGKFAQSSVKAAMESERVAAQTAAVLKSTGGAAGVAASDVEALASSMQSLTGISDEEIQSSENLLLTFRDIKAEGGVFEEATRSIADMSVAMNKGQLAGLDLKSATIQVGKALNDPIKGMSALQRVGVSFTAAQTKQIEKMQESGNLMGAQKMILAELKKEFGGAAQAAGGTFEGAIAKLGNSFNDFQEKLGEGIIPALNEFIKFASKGVDLLNDIGTAAKELGGGFEVEEADTFQAHVEAATKDFAKGKITIAEYNKKLLDLDKLYREASGGATSAGLAQTALGDAVRKGTISSKKAEAAQKGIISTGAKANAIADAQAKLTKINTVLQAQAAGKIRLSASEMAKAQSEAGRLAAQIRSLSAGLKSLPQVTKTTVQVAVQQIGNAVGNAGRGLATGGIKAAANGMIARSPTLIAEGRYSTSFGTGAEAVLPLNDQTLGRLGRAISRAGGGAGGGTVIHIHGSVYGKPRDFAEAVDRALTHRTLQRAG